MLAQHCSEHGTVITDGSFMIDARLNFDNVARPTCNSMMICCAKSSHIPPSKVTKCHDFETHPTCGIRNPNGIEFKTVSMQNKTLFANYAEFPWMMAVMDKDMKLLAGGSLIMDNVVITAAHTVVKIQNFRELTVRGGEWNTQTELELCDHVDRKVENVILHERFIKQNLQNDIALLVLRDPFVMTPAINVICLPPKNNNFENHKCFSSGWGRKFFNVRELYQAYLKKVEMSVVESQQCQDLLRETRLGKDFVLDEGFLCAGKRVHSASLSTFLLLFDLFN